VAPVTELEDNRQSFLVAGAGLIEVPDMESESAEVTQPAALEGRLVEVASDNEGLVELVPSLGVVPEPEVEDA
jgi:hypothetical protein